MLLLSKRLAIEKQGDSVSRRSSAEISLYKKLDDDDVWYATSFQLLQESGIGIVVMYC
jgi:hypothetical protein